MSSITILDENDKSELNQNISTKSPKLHTHTTNDIEGVFTVEKGGTGLGEDSFGYNKVLYATSESSIGQMEVADLAPAMLAQEAFGPPVWVCADDIENTTRSIVTLTGYPGTKYKFSRGYYSGTIGSSGSDTRKIRDLGEYTIDLKYSGAKGTRTLTINKVGMYTVDCHLVTFNAASYSEISTASRNGSAASMWSIGDTKAVTLNGLVGAYNFSNETTYMFIMAFDHNSSVEMNGEHHIVCSFAKSALTGGKDIAFVDQYYGIYDTTSSARFRMNASKTNSGGWASSYMRQTICSQFKNALPFDLRNILRSRTIYTDNTGGRNNTPSYVTATNDYVYLPSEFEVQGKIELANAAEQNYQQQFAYYKNGASKRRYQSNNLSAEVHWFFRSPGENWLDQFCSADNFGDLSPSNANSSEGFAPLITL